MVTLVVGVPDSGKSALAEDLTVKMAGDGKKIYVATMEVLDEEGKKRVEKHKKLRDGKGFLTVEAPVEVSKALADVPEIGHATVLLECISNLVGNVMHGDEFRENTVEAVVKDVVRLCRMAGNVVLVTNSFPADDDGYEDDTRQYVRCLDEVNERLYKVADVIYKFRSEEHI